MKLSPLSLLVVVLALGACGDDADLEMFAGDADVGGGGVTVDAGQGGMDATIIDLGVRDMDAGFADSSGIIPDSGGVVDSGTAVDSGTPDSGVPPMPCSNFNTLGPVERDRVVLVGQTFTANSSIRGTEVRSMTLTQGGTLNDDGIRLNVGAEPVRFAFMPSGTLVLVLANDVDPMQDDHLISVAVTDAQTLSIVDRIRLPNGDMRDIELSADARTAYVVGSNVAETSGVSVVDVACDGSLTLVEDQFLNVILASAWAWLPGQMEAILLGGQAVFTMPPDPDDLRWIGFNGRAPAQLDSYDIWGDSIDAYDIAVSPDGATLVVPNGSAFSNEGSQVLIAQLDRTNRTITETQRLMGFSDARSALFSTDGQTLLVNQFQPGRVAILQNQSGWSVVDEIFGIGLTEAMAQVERGSLTGRVLLPSVDPSGEPNIAQLQITGPGTVSDLGQIDLGAGSENIPGAIAIVP